LGQFFDIFRGPERFLEIPECEKWARALAKGARRELFWLDLSFFFLFFSLFPLSFLIPDD